MSKIVIIGGGIAGLTAGVFAQKYGFESEIFESNAMPGGECTGWNRNGFHIDNCIHRLTGTDKHTSLYQLWEDIGALGDDVDLIQLDYFYKSYFEEKSAALWRDKERTRKELKKIGREDGRAIDEFLDAVTALEKMQLPAAMPMDMLPKLQLMKLGMSMMGCMKYMKKYGKISLQSYADSFKSPLLKQFFNDYLDGQFSAFSLMMSYATFLSGNGDIPKGGSVAMVQRIVQKYQSLGGVLHTNSPVVSINVEGATATGITLADGTAVQADYIIPACDPSVTFGKLLDRTYMPKQLAENYRNLKVQSAFQAAFSVDDECKFINNEIFSCREITVGKSLFHRVGVKSYWYEPQFAPAGKAVLQVHFSQTEDDYDYWCRLHDTNKAEYDRQKKYIAEQIILSLSGQYQQINGKIEVIDVLTPYTYHKWTGAYKGSYMSFIFSPQAMGQQSMTGLIDGLDNVVLATQWQQLPGGLPVAAVSGKFAVQRIAQ